MPLAFFAVLAADLNDVPKVIENLETLADTYKNFIVEPTPQLPEYDEVELID